MKVSDKRQINRYGMMIADAVLAKTGALPYTRSELNLKDGDPNGVVMVNRTKETLQDALSTMKGAPVTIDHPREFIDSRNARGLVVGQVATEPRIDESGKVRAELNIFDQTAISKVKDGEHELSPGFDFVLSNLTDSSAEIKDMQVNHIAIVRRGRAGASVRILDHLPPALRHDYGALHMNDDLKEAVTKAVNDAMSQKASDKMNFDQMKSELITAVTDGLKPVLDEVVSKVQTAQDDKTKEESTKATDAAIEEAVKAAVDAERTKFAVVSEATPFIAEDKHNELLDMSTEDVLKLAIGDTVKGTDSMDAAELRGVLRGIAATSKSNAKDAKPEGVVKVGDSENTNTAADRMAKHYLKRASERNGGKK